MRAISQVKFQIGKNGVTDGVIGSLDIALKSHRQVRVSCLKSSGRNKNKMGKIAEELKSKLPYKINYKILGFTIIIIKN